MSLKHVLLTRGGSSLPPNATNTRLQRNWRIPVRVAWVSLVILLLGLFVILLPSYFALLQSICTTSACALLQPTPQSVQALQQLGLSVANYAVLNLALISATMVVCVLMGIVIFWRKSDDWMALLAAFFMVFFGMLYVTDALQASPSTRQVLAIVLNVLGNGILFLVSSLFPNGRFVPRWSRWLVLGWVLWGMVFLTLHDLPSMYLVDRLVWLGVVICLIGAQFYRYRWVSSSIERQQTKWVVFVGSLTALVLVGLTIPGLLIPALRQPGSLYQVLIGPIYPLGVLFIALSVGIAILRYRLWDIDIIINRTLVYGTLTSILAVIYVGLVLSLQVLLHGIVSQDNSVAIVISTLIIAALFQPLRHRLQKIIDRRFYRSKYDAAKIIQGFAATLRSEVDLTTLSERLQDVVQETMQPTHVSLWLRPPAKHQNTSNPLEQ
jgi:hypothetical protein